MGRRLRFIPPGGALVEVTTRTLHSRYLLRPTPWVNEAIIGILARAKRRYSLVQVCALVFMSNHCHLLLWVPDAKVLSSFMEFVNGNVAREIGRLIGWRERFWSRRYQHIVVSDEPSAQIERLRYILSHGVKEDLVKRAEEWPGVHGVSCLLHGEVLRGYWFDRSREIAARRRGDVVERLTHATPATLRLDPLPCWRHLAEHERRHQVARMVAEIEAHHRQRRGRERKWVLGVHGVKARDPHEAPRKSKKSLAPWCHASNRKVRRSQADAGFFRSSFSDSFRGAAGRRPDGRVSWWEFSASVTVCRACCPSSPAASVAGPGCRSEPTEQNRLSRSGLGRRGGGLSGTAAELDQKGLGQRLVLARADFKSRLRSGIGRLEAGS